MTTYHRHQQRAQAACGRAGKHDKSVQGTERPLASAETREALWETARTDPAKFARCCRLSQVFALNQLPGWPEFVDAWPYEASLVVLEARTLGIRC